MALDLQQLAPPWQPCLDQPQGTRHLLILLHHFRRLLQHDPHFHSFNFSYRRCPKTIGHTIPFRLILPCRCRILCFMLHSSCQDKVMIKEHLMSNHFTWPLFMETSPDALGVKKRNLWTPDGMPHPQPDDVCLQHKVFQNPHTGLHQMSSDLRNVYYHA